MLGDVEVTTPLGRVRRSRFEPGATLHEVYLAQQIPTSLPVVCTLNGKPVLRRRWRRRHGKRVHRDYLAWHHRRVRAGDVVAFTLLPAGGEGGKNILRTVAVIAVAVVAAVVAPIAAPFVAGAFGIGTGVATALVGSAIVFGGTALVSALIPVKAPSLVPTSPSAQGIGASLTAGGGGGGGAGVSPTYSLSPVGNQARLLQPIPRLYGTHRIVPDLAAQPYTRFIGNEQFLYQLFCLGLGEYTQTEVRIGEIVAWKNGSFTGRFPGLTLEFFSPSQAVTTFPAAVDVSPEVNGQELRTFLISNITLSGNVLTITPNAPTGYVLTGFRTGDSVSITSAGANDGAYVIQSVDGEGQMTMTTTFPSPGTFGAGNVILAGQVGGFSACRPGRTVTTVDLDFVFPNGLAHFNDTGDPEALTVTFDIQARQIDDNGIPLSGYATVLSRTHTLATRQPQRFTETISVAAARWEFVVARATANSMISRDVDKLHWTGLRGYWVTVQTFPDVTTMAIIARAGLEFSEATSRQFSVIQTAKLPKYQQNLSAWTLPETTSSPAWALADVCRNAVYGLGRADNEIDITSLLVLDSYAAVTGFTFNGVFDTQKTAWECLRDICATVNAYPLLLGNIITFIQDDQGDLARGVFTPRNIRRGTIEWRHVMAEPNSPEAVIVEFLNDTTWQPDEVECILPGTAGENLARISIFGCTQAEQAQQLGLRIAAGNRFRRVYVTFDTELEGKLLLRGDPIIVSHDVISWGQSGELVAISGEELTLSEPVVATPGQDYYISVNTNLNRQWGPCKATPDENDPYVVALDPVERLACDTEAGAAIQIFGQTQDDDQMPTRYAFGTLTSYAKRCKIVSIVAKDNETVTVAAFVDDERVYAYASAVT